MDPDPHHFGNLDPHKFADDKPILPLFQGFESLLGN
jgi:hypothetical protein